MARKFFDEVDKSLHRNPGSSEPADSGTEPAERRPDFFAEVDGCLESMKGAVSEMEGENDKIGDLAEKSGVPLTSEEFAERGKIIPMAKVVVYENLRETGEILSGKDRVFGNQPGFRPEPMPEDERKKLIDRLVVAYRRAFGEPPDSDVSDENPAGDGVADRLMAGVNQAVDESSFSDGEPEKKSGIKGGAAGMSGETDHIRSGATLFDDEPAPGRAGKFRTESEPKNIDEPKREPWEETAVEDEDIISEEEFVAENAVDEGETPESDKSLRFRELGEEIAAKSASLRKFEGFFGTFRLMSKEARNRHFNLQEDLEAAKNEYSDLRKEIVGGNVARALEERRDQAERMRRAIESDRGYGTKVYDAYRKLGEWNLIAGVNLIRKVALGKGDEPEWLPDSRLGKMAGRAVSVRTAISLGLLGGGVLLGGITTAAGAGVLAARRTVGGVSSGFGSYDLMRAIADRKTDRLGPETVAAMDADQLDEILSGMDIRAAAGGRSVGENPAYRQISEELDRKWSERLTGREFWETPEAVAAENHLASWLSERLSKSDEMRKRLTVKDRRKDAVMRGLVVGIGILGGGGLIAKGIGKVFGLGLDVSGVDGKGTEMPVGAENPITDMTDNRPIGYEIFPGEKISVGVPDRVVSDTPLLDGYMEKAVGDLGAAEAGEPAVGPDLIPGAIVRDGAAETGTAVSNQPASGIAEPFGDASAHEAVMGDTVSPAGAAREAVGSVPANPEVRFGHGTVSFRYGPDGRISGHDIRYSVPLVDLQAPSEKLFGVEFGNKTLLSGNLSVPGRVEGFGLKGLINLEGLNGRYRWPFVRLAAERNIEKAGRQVLAMREAAAELVRFGRGGSAEANYLKQAVARMIGETESKYGNVFR